MILDATHLPLSDRERLIVAQIARYHRRALPSPDHKHYDRLAPADRYRVNMLSGLLRVADGLDRCHCDCITDVRCKIEPNLLEIRAETGLGGAELEIETARRKSKLLVQMLRRPIHFTAQRTSAS